MDINEFFPTNSGSSEQKVTPQQLHTAVQKRKDEIVVGIEKYLVPENMGGRLGRWEEGISELSCAVYNDKLGIDRVTHTPSGNQDIDKTPPFEPSTVISKMNLEYGEGHLPKASRSTAYHWGNDRGYTEKLAYALGRIDKPHSFVFQYSVTLRRDGYEELKRHNLSSFNVLCEYDLTGALIQISIPIQTFSNSGGQYVNTITWIVDHLDDPIIEGALSGDLSYDDLKEVLGFPIDLKPNTKSKDIQLPFGFTYIDDRVRSQLAIPLQENIQGFIETINVGHLDSPIQGALGSIAHK